MKMSIAGCVCVCALAVAVPVRAASFNFDLSGKAGTGLLTGNENPTVVGTASGGEIGTGILYDNVSKLLSIDVGWGSGNGFSNLTGTATNMHIHGPTTDGAPTSFTESAGVLITLDSLAGFNNSATSGGFNGITPALTGSQETALFAGALYLNVHTSANGGGEIRGYLVQAVPEPSSCLLFALGIGALGLRRARSRK